MAINKKLIHFTNKTNFLNEYNNGNILPTSIVFILDAKQIWTHNEFYSCPFTEEEINQLLVGSNIKLNGYTEITSPIEISATDTVNQAFGKIEDYLNSILELNAVLVDTGDAVYESPMINDYITANTFSSTLLNYVTDSELASKNYATKQDVANLVDGAPETLDTLNELAAALKDNADIVDVLNESISNKLDKTDAELAYATKVELEATSMKWSVLEKSDNSSSGPVIDATGKANGVYVVTAAGQLVDKTTVDPTAIGVALITANQSILIEKMGEANTDIIKAAYDADGATNTDYKNFYWGVYGSDVAGITNISSSGAAKQDFNGKDNTAAIIATPDTDSNTTYANMSTYCTKFNEMSGIYADWYIPACGQLYEIYTNVTDINTALTNIGGTTFNTAEYFWSSSESSSSNAWVVNFRNGYVSDRNDKINNTLVRFVRNLQ